MIKKIILFVSIIMIFSMYAFAGNPLTVDKIVDAKYYGRMNDQFRGSGMILFQYNGNNVYGMISQINGMQKYIIGNNGTGKFSVLLKGNFNSTQRFSSSNIMITYQIREEQSWGRWMRTTTQTKYLYVPDTTIPAGSDGVEIYYNDKGEIDYSPYIFPIGNKITNPGKPIYFRIFAKDNNNDRLTYSATNLPSGATFTGQIFSWMPKSSQTGLHNIIFTASDGNTADTETVTITVN